MAEDMTEVPVQQIAARQQDADASLAPRPHLPDLSGTAVLLDIDGTLIDLAPTPHGIVVPQGLADTLNGLLARTSGALALVSGRSLADIDLIFAPDKFPAVGGHGAEMRFAVGSEAVDVDAPPMADDLRRRLALIAAIDPRILVEDKGYSLALHYRLALEAEPAIHARIAAIRAEFPGAPIEVLAGKCVLEIKHSGFTKATGVRALMDRAPFRGRRPLFIGDDVTDEAAFAVMPEFDGFSFSVGRKLPGMTGYFETPSEVRGFLARLLRA